MAKTLPVTFADGSTLPASDLNTSFQTFVTNTFEVVSPMDGNISGAGLYKLTNLIAGSSAGDSVRYEQLGWNLIGTQSASASATVDFTTGLTSTYNHYVITFTNVVPATDDVFLHMRVSQAGVFNSGASSYQWARMGLAAGDSSAGVDSDQSDSQIDIAGGVGNATGESLSGQLFFANPASTTRALNFVWSATWINASGFITLTQGTGSTSGISLAAIDGIRFFASSGNISSGEFALYGVRKV